MAEPEVTEQAPESAGGGGKKKLILIAGAVVALIGGVVGVLFALGVIGGSEPIPEDGDAVEADPGQSAKPVDPSVVLPTIALEPFVVNLADTDQNRFLKITVVVELTKEDLVEQVEQRKEKIKDAVLTLLSSKSVGQVRDSKGKLRLKQEITLRLNEILGTNSVNEILFTEFIIS